MQIYLWINAGRWPKIVEGWSCRKTCRKRVGVANRRMLDGVDGPNWPEDSRDSVHFNSARFPLDNWISNTQKWNQFSFPIWLIRLVNVIYLSRLTRRIHLIDNWLIGSCSAILIIFFSQHCKFPGIIFCVWLFFSAYRSAATFNLYQRLISGINLYFNVMQGTWRTEKRYHVNRVQQRRSPFN